MVRFKSTMLCGMLVAAGALLGSCWGWSSPPGGVAGAVAVATDQTEDRSQAYSRLDRDVRSLERPGQFLDVIPRTIGISRTFVVHIDAKKREGSRGRLVEEAGAGVVLERGGRFYILTNRHVINDADNARITIQLDDGRKIHPARVIADIDTDVAVMPVAVIDLTPARFGNSRDVEVGQYVMAMGSPFGLNHSVSTGIVSAMGRRELKLGGESLRYQDFIQTDAAINPGNSGGPLLNLRGEVIGLATAIASASGNNEGIGFCIPINMALFVAHQLIDHGVVRRARLGVSLDREYDADAALRLGLSRLEGTRVTSVDADTPAAAAGLRAGDILLSYDDVPVESDIHLVNLVGMTPVGKNVKLIVLRDGRRFESSVTLSVVRQMSHLAPLPTVDNVLARLNGKDVWKMDAFGIEVVNLDPLSARRIRLSPDTVGMMIADVNKSGPLAGRVRRGDIIEAIDGQTVASVGDLRRILKSRTDTQKPRLRIVTGMFTDLGARRIQVTPK